MSSDLNIIMRGAGRIASIAVLVSLAVFICGCDSDDGGRDINLSHKAHIEKRQMECVDCHEGAEDTETPGMPSEKLCLDCHKTLDKELKGKDSPASEKCLYCHNPKQNKSISEQKVVLGPGVSKTDLVPVHVKHTEKEIGCEACHGNIAADDNKILPRHKYMASGKICVDCHTQKGLSTDCATCHKTYELIEPDDHKINWIAQHGVESMLAGENEHGKSCSTCHAKSECKECHTQKAPRDHTNFWRQRGHGIMAGMDRDKCLVCHRQDACVRCHRETAPRNHKGAWKSTHCGACHLQSSFTPENNTCAVCHRQIPHVVP